MAKELTDIIKAAAVVRDETAAEQNTATRVGSVLADLAHFVGEALFAAGLSVKSNSTGVSLLIKYHNAEGQAYINELPLPLLNNEQAGVATPQLIDYFQTQINSLNERYGVALDKLENYPSQMMKDLGLVSSQDIGEKFAARSEIAGNRQISFIRFEVNGVSARKTTLILQWPNGVNETAQIKFVDKAQWRRNVSGATGVEGNVTTATQWERTAPHYIGYDAARRMVQLKDYTQTVSREVQLPLATSAQHGLMSSTDKEALDNAAEKADTALRMMPFDGVFGNPTIETQGVSSYDAIIFDDIRCMFLARKNNKFYMSFIGIEDYNAITSGTMKARTDRIFFRTDTKRAYIFNGAALSNLSISDEEVAKLANYPNTPLEIPLASKKSQGLMSASDKAKTDAYPNTPQEIPTATEADPGLMSAADKAKINNYPSTPLEIPLATLQKPGLMAAADCRNLSQASSTASANKAKLDKYPAQFVMDFGLVESQAAGEQMAAASEVAGNRNISFIRFQVNGVSALRTTLILQWPNGINETAQLKFSDKTEWRRNVTGATGASGATTTATQWERTAPHYLGYDTARRMVQLKDYTQTVSREVELPLATSTQPGLMSASDKTKLGNYPTSPNVFTPTTAFQAIVSKTEQNEQRIGVLESVHAPSDYVEMTITNEQTQRNVLFWKIECIDDLTIDGQLINTDGLEGKFFRTLSAGEHQVRFRVSEENRTQRGLLGWADDESAGYLSHVTRIVIPEGWEELPANCFENRKHLEEIVLPSTLRIVGGNCFQSLPALRELIVPKNVTTINWSAINDCASLKSIRMGGSGSMTLSLSYEAIRNCPSLTCIEILPCKLTFKGSTSPFQNLPQLSALICHLTEEPTFEPASPFGNIGSNVSNKILYRPAGIAFYASGYWSTQLCTTLGFTPSDI